MKKLILIISFFACISSVKAQYYGDSDVLFQTEIMLGGCHNRGDFKHGSFITEMILGARINPFFFVGGGFNINLEMGGTGDFSILSYLVNFKVYIPAINEKIYPFGSLSIGYADGMGDIQEYGGLYLAPGVGLNFQLHPVFSLFVMGSYDKLNLSESNGYKINGNNLSFKLGWVGTF